MKGSVKINIGGQDFYLKSDNEELLKSAADEVNIRISEIKKSYKTELLPSTQNVLASLNIAEDNIILHQRIESDHNLLLSEMNRMIEVLENALEPNI